MVNRPHRCSVAGMAHPLRLLFQLGELEPANLDSCSAFKRFGAGMCGQASGGLWLGKCELWLFLAPQAA
jgi:hypothetical protein